ncbi:MAG: hypothetical protein PHD54_13015 [Desulfuromonadaceae bacterium]|nr:hypothetical protein [Desulfuromonadaceae bacterium]
MNSVKILLLVTVVFLVSNSQVSFCQPIGDGKGVVNWTDGFIESVGYGTATPSGQRGKDRINSRRAAEVAAQRALLETIKGVMVDSLTTVENSMLKEDYIRTRVDGIVKGAQIVDEKLTWEDSAPVYMVKMRICLNGGVLECKGNSLVNVLDLEKRAEPAFVPQKVLIVVSPPQAAVDKAPPVDNPPRSYPFDPSKPATGVIFTLDGRYFEKSLLPVVVTYSAQDGPVTVYSAKIVKPSVIRSYGAVRYAETVENAFRIPQIGGNALVVQAVEITKENMIVIKAQDAVKIKETLAHGNNYLSDAKVVITGR